MLSSVRRKGKEQAAEVDQSVMVERVGADKASRALSKREIGFLKRSQKEASGGES
jgi:hypothetical protein